MNSIMKKIRIKLTEISKEKVKYRKIIRFLMNLYRKLRYFYETFWVKVDCKYVVFSCFSGKSYSCSPKAIYEYMIHDERFADYKFVWAFKKDYLYLHEFSNKNNTVVVKYGSKKFRRFLAKSKFWVFNYKFNDYLKPKKNQIFVQCWHGTPLKRLGCDLVHFDNVLNTMDEMKKRYHIEAEKIDYFISPSPFATQKFISAWDLEKIKKSDIVVEEGYPRNDFLVNYTDNDIKNVKVRLFGYYYLIYEQKIKRKKIILYAPTYRSNQHTTGVGYTQNLLMDLDYWYKELSEDYIILFRTHYFISNRIEFDKYQGFIYDVSNFDDINELFIISDILITDYSSVMFDYAVLKRPMIFYMYDLDYYKNQSNGFYFDVEEELPGRIVKNDFELIEEINNITADFVYDDKYRRFNEKYNCLDDGNATKRVVEKIFL